MTIAMDMELDEKEFSEEAKFLSKSFRQEPSLQEVSGTHLDGQCFFCLSLSLEHFVDPFLRRASICWWIVPGSYSIPVHRCRGRTSMQIREFLNCNFMGLGFASFCSLEE